MVLRENSFETTDFKGNSTLETMPLVGLVFADTLVFLFPLPNFIICYVIKLKNINMKEWLILTLEEMQNKIIEIIF